MKKRNVLVVDDETINHLLCQRALATYDRIDKIYIAYNGNQALQLMRDHCDGRVELPDVILLDLDMPQMGGFQFIEEFHALDCLDGRQSEVVIAVVSSSINPRHQLQAKAMGVRHFIDKPFSLEKMKELITLEFSSN